ncbi:Required for respiratory growth protein 9 [Penicillium diatomitis]|uniref:Required for respiratory growth protein 9, mitochondrial n=1 Tax=Penicillium diatomitis TaxID=2819901 RepID=A0A9W9X5D6_9EURO|nr:Required for respiratory growth protein 9 [Penicillium diatomitis]KAJ5484139.1 Required for respiratory growth protein 9 [Penicillium diatomitis]
MRELHLNGSPGTTMTSANPSATHESTPATSSSAPAELSASASASASTTPESQSTQSRWTKSQQPLRKGRTDNKQTKRDPERTNVKGRKTDKPKATPKTQEKAEPWRTQKDALEKKFPQGWNPPKRLSPDALEGIRHLHATAPEQFTTSVLAEEFKVSPEAIRRILKSRWRPSETEAEARRKRWEKRHERIWSRMAELGLRPTTKASRPYSDANTLYKSGERGI